MGRQAGSGSRRTGEQVGATGGEVADGQTKWEPNELQVYLQTSGNRGPFRVRSHTYKHITAQTCRQTGRQVDRLIGVVHRSPQAASRQIEGDVDDSVNNRLSVQRVDRRVVGWTGG